MSQSCEPTSHAILSNTRDPRLATIPDKIMPYQPVDSVHNGWQIPSRRTVPIAFNKLAAMPPGSSQPAVLVPARITFHDKYWLFSKRLVLSPISPGDENGTCEEDVPSIRSLMECSVISQPVTAWRTTAPNSNRDIKNTLKGRLQRGQQHGILLTSCSRCTT